MNRRLLPFGLLALLALAPLAAPAARADDAAPEGVDPADLALWPLTGIQKAYLLRDRPDLAFRLHVLTERAKRVAAHLAAREDASDPAGVALLEELDRVRRDLAPLAADLRRVLPAYGVEPEAFDRVRTAPRGPLREVRYARSLVLSAPDVDPRARDLLARLVPAVDGARLALEALRRAGGEAAPAVDGAGADVERRFWWVADSLLDPGAMRWVRRRLPADLQELADAVGHVFRVPGLGASQASRVKALLVELDAEGAADQAAAKRAEERRAEPGLAEDAARAAAREKDAAERRQRDRWIAAFERLRELLTPEQWTSLESVPPFLSAEDRLRNPKQVLEGVLLAPAQAPLLKALAARYEADKRRFEAEVAALGAAAAEHGPDSPMQDMRLAEGLALQGRAHDVLRRAAREVLLDVLHPDQVLAWVLGVPR